jgi:hypothetical protein
MKREDSMEYKKGDRVRHPKVHEWGIGEVLADSAGGSVKVFFVGAGEKSLSLQYVQPVKVPADEASHPVLDNLKISKSATGIQYQNLAESIQVFLETFPEGFYGQKFTTHEREYKDKAHTLARTHARQGRADRVGEEGDYGEIAKRASQVVNATNLIFPNEKMALKDGLATPAHQKLFADSLSRILFGEGPLKERFEEFAGVLEEIEADKWTTATYFPFLFHPDSHMFIKPTITRHAAELCGFEINYDPQLNWRTYRSVLEFSRYLFDELSELKPRDMIEVQSFMWCIAPGTYQGQ